MQITFHGGAGGVTGSKHLIEFEDKKILLDCGLFQGRRKEARKLNSEFPFDPKNIDAVVLSHAHLDHCGLLPLLVKQEFGGKIFSTPATKDVTQRMLEDSAGIQEMDYRYLKKRKDRRYEELAHPLYTKKDIPFVMRRFKTLPYVRNGAGWHEILSGVKLKFYDAGHILGSAVSVLEFKSGTTMTRVAYTGDLGRRNVPILHNPHYIRDRVNLMLAESTYGSRVHRRPEEAEEKLAKAVQYVCDNKSKLIVPAFSLGRTQVIVYLLHHLTDSGRIQRVPIYVDSPLAGRITEVFKKHRNDYDLTSRLDFPRKGDVPLAFRNLIYTQSRDESIQLNHTKGPLVIISASGMLEGGRVLHHLKNSLRSKKNVVLFTGYQAVNTLGRRILEGESPVRIYGRKYHVNARVTRINELSAHADSRELSEYISRTKGLKKVFLVHGEPDRAQALKRVLKKNIPDITIGIPKRGQRVIIGE